MRRITKGLVLAGVIALCMSGGAVAAKKLTGVDIINGSLTGKEFKKGSIDESRLSQDVRRKLNTTISGSAGVPGAKGDTGATGAQGAKGETGAKGDKGDPGEKGDRGLDSDDPRVVNTAKLRGFTLAPKGDNGSATDNGTLTFEEPPAAPTLGNKSLKFTSANGKPVVVYLPLPSGYDAVNGPRPLLGEVTKISYGSLIHTQPQNALDVGFQFEVLKANVGSASGYTTVVFEPYQSGADETKDVWHRHSVDNSRVWSTRAVTGLGCTQAAPCSFREFREANPYAEVLTAKLRIGQNSGEGWSGFEGYVDDLSFGFGPVTRYDLGG
jgi:hypothetical protein